MGPEGGGPNVEGMNPDETSAERKRFAKSTIQHFSLTSKSSDDEIAEAAHSVGIHVPFLKITLAPKSLALVELRCGRPGIRKYGKKVVKPAPVAIPDSDFIIDANWESIPRERETSNSLRAPRVNKPLRFRFETVYTS